MERSIRSVKLIYMQIFILRKLTRLLVVTGALFMAMFYQSAALSAPDGEALFGEHCSVCHGDNGQGGIGIPLSSLSFLNSVPDDYIKQTIRLGRPGRIMPAFSELSDIQVEAIAAYIRSWSKEKAPVFVKDTIAGDVKAGEKLFQQRCASCHGKDGKGGKGTGVTFSRERDLPIIAPALNNAGFLAAATDHMIRHTIVNGREQTPMSSAFVKGLTKQKIDDLVSYIRSFEKTINEVKPEDKGAPVIIVDSPYGLEETVENLKQAIADQNFTLIRTDYLEHGLVDEGAEDHKQVVVHFCNFEFLFEALTIDPRVGLFLPCRVTVIEEEGKVRLMTINPLHLSDLFNNDELEKSCKEMHQIYSDLLEDASL